MAWAAKIKGLKKIKVCCKVAILFRTGGLNKQDETFRDDCTEFV